jgi:PhnB protein
MNSLTKINKTNFMAQANPYINFNGNCKEAMNFYKECIGGELTLMPVAGTPIEAQCPPAMADQIAHASLIKNGFVLMATDMVRPEGYKPGNNMAVSVNCESEEEINAMYSRLSEGGSVIESLKEQFWGAKFGAIVDKFGICWMFNYDKNQQQR